MLDPTPHLPPQPPSLPTAPAGLTAADLTRIAAAAGAARAASTHKLYRHTWDRWVRWCATRDLDPLPADPAAVCAYLTERVETGLAVISLGTITSALRYVHLGHGHRSPTDHPAVRQVLAGLRHTHGTAPVRQARPLTVTDLRRLLTALDRTRPSGARDAAFILLGYAGALRTSELAALTVADLESRPDGLVVRIRRSKTDPDGAGARVGIARGTHPDTDPITAVGHWLQLRGHTPGPVFTRLRGAAADEGQGLTAPTFARLLTAHATAAGLTDPERITGHSLRAGHATTAHQAGVSLARIAAQTRHKDLAVLFERYIRPLDVLTTTSSRDLGL